MMAEITFKEGGTKGGKDALAWFREWHSCFDGTIPDMGSEDESACCNEPK